MTTPRSAQVEGLPRERTHFDFGPIRGDNPAFGASDSGSGGGGGCDSGNEGWQAQVLLLARVGVGKLASRRFVTTQLTEATSKGALLTHYRHDSVHTIDCILPEDTHVVGECGMVVCGRVFVAWCRSPMGCDAIRR